MFFFQSVVRIRNTAWGETMWKKEWCEMSICNKIKTTATGVQGCPSNCRMIPKRICNGMMAAAQEGYQTRRCSNVLRFGDWFQKVFATAWRRQQRKNLRDCVNECFRDQRCMGENARHFGSGVMQVASNAQSRLHKAVNANCFSEILRNNRNITLCLQI